MHLARALRPRVKRSSTLHEEAIRVLMRLANNDVLLREASMVPMSQVMLLRMLQVDRGVEQALMSR